MVKIRVPATSANMRPGFDSMGIALTLYNYITAEETGDGKLVIDIPDDSEKYLARDERNLVYKAMQRLFRYIGYEHKGLKLTLENNVPLTRGLGSSSAGIVGGLAAANKLTGGKVSDDELLRLATELEGHPDNVSPALLGGFTVSVLRKDRLGRIAVDYVKTDMNDDLRFAALIPDFILKTKKSRTVLPNTVSRSDAVYNTGHSALLASSLILGKYDNIRYAVGDKLHQRFRKTLVPHMDDLFSLCYAKGALGVYLSGAGPTVMAMVRRNNQNFEREVREALEKKYRRWSLKMLDVDNRGAAQIG